MPVSPKDVKKHMHGRKQPFLFVGGHPCLDFINTQMMVKGQLTDLLERFEDLGSWLLQANLVTKAQWKSVSTQLDHREQEGLLEEAKTLRATLRVAADRIVARKTIPDSTFDAINRVLSRRPGYPQLVRTREGEFERRFHFVAVPKESLLPLLAEAASDLLCLPDLSLVKKCGNPSCVLYFYDSTKNHTRNWCSMQLCGNRMKVAAYFRRKRRTPQH